MWPKLGRPGDRTEVVCECCAAHTRHGRLGESLWPAFGLFELGHKIPSLNVEASGARALNGGSGVLSRTSAVELSPEVFGSCSPY